MLSSVKMDGEPLFISLTTVLDNVFYVYNNNNNNVVDSSDGYFN